MGRRLVPARRAAYRWHAGTAGLLVQDLALGVLSVQEVADRYGVPAAEIREFAEDYCLEIQHLREGGSRLDSLWVLDKASRLRALQVETERAFEMIGALTHEYPDGEGGGGGALEGGAHAVPRHADDIAHGAVARYQVVIQRLLLAVAAEVGDLPVRAPNRGRGRRVDHMIRGVKIEDV